MLPIERQNRIKTLIRSKRNIKISELSEELGVSEMTVHRDLQPLIEEGVVIKTFGGITLGQESSIPSSYDDTCVFCGRKIGGKLSYRLILSHDQIEAACCGHCGLLRHHQLGDKVMQAISHDFLKHTTISAAIASYVMDTSVHMGCCQPQVLTFEWRDDANKFVKGFGGTVYTFCEAMTALFQKMQGDDDRDSCMHHE